MCNQCEALMINGVYCHEIGCPESWKDYKRECKWCGQDFKPKEKYQNCCSQDCSKSYHQQGGYDMKLAHNKPDIVTAWFDYLDFRIRFMLNDYPVVYIGGQDEVFYL